MLDVMRRRKGYVRVILSVVVVSVAASFAFTIYGIWGGALTSSVQGQPAWIASVDGKRIPTRVFQRQRATVENDLRERFGAEAFDAERMGAFIDQQALGSILGQHLAQREAERSGLKVTAAEIRDSIINSPSFQREGRFVGVDLYRRILAANRLEVTEFEREHGEGLAADKLRMVLFSLARVDDADLEKRFRDEVERVDVDYVLLADAAYAGNKAPTAAEVQAYFNAHASSYMTPEARRAAYVLFDREAKAATIDVPEADVRASYDRDKGTRYSHPEQRRASHILFRSQPGDAPEKETELRTRAGEVLARIRSGDDFAALARQHSEDPGSATNGGDLGFFGRGAMVKEFEDAAFSLSVGSVSDVVKSPFGFHILKVTESRPAGVQPFEEVQGDIRRSLAVQRAQEAIRKAADAFSTAIGSQESSFDKSAAASGYAVSDTGFFAKGEPAGTLGRLPQVDEAILSLKPGGVTPPVAVPQGLAVFSLAEVREPRPAPFESVKGGVETDLKRSRARDKARAVAAEILAGSGSLQARCEKRKLEVKSYPKVSRIQPLPPLTDASKAAAFAASTGAVLGPHDSEDGLVVIEVKGHSPATPAEEASEREALRRRLLDDERSALFQAMIARLQKASRIEVNEPLLREGRRGG